jgi:hypothetical protein
MGTTAKVRAACLLRLDKTFLFAERWHEVRTVPEAFLSLSHIIALQALGLMVLPGNAASSALHLGNLVNAIWNFAGDTSTDVGFLTRNVVQVH